MMITHSRSRRGRALVAAFVVLLCILFMLRGWLQSAVARLLVVLPHQSAPEPAYQGVLYQALAEENAELSAMLKLPHQLIFAGGRVAARPPKTVYDTLLTVVDRHAGVATGDLVLYKGIYLGTVSSVAGDAVLITLASSPGMITEARAGTPAAIIIMHGLGGGAFGFEIPSSVALVPGDLVTVSGLPIAVVRSVTPLEGNASAAVLAASPVSAASLSIVEFMHPH